ncbi:MAG: helix-turn-helix domain-containing protein [Desulfuromonadales bacterium]|nr:helix-turn-helix domain-containing protein [Desulfuromonadales bacterium]MBN2792567.1 helix-turn-helix domain-containing protein [Desulfuromonadales bacterium]
MDAKIEDIDCLVNHLLAQRSADEMSRALRELLTASELAEVTNRLQIFELLEQGVPQRQIADQLGVGIATVTRGSNALKQRKAE